MEIILIRKLQSALYTVTILIACADSAASQKLYLAQRDTGLYQANVDGTGFSRIVPPLAPDFFGFSDVDVDLQGRALYLSTPLGDIWRTNLDGANAQVILDTALGIQTVAVDTAHERVYYGAASDTPFQVHSINLNGSDFRVDLNERAGDLAVDPAAGYLFTNRLTRARKSSRNRAVRRQRHRD
jgi:hypothetical protein